MSFKQRQDEAITAFRSEFGEDIQTYYVEKKVGGHIWAITTNSKDNLPKHRRSLYEASVQAREEGW